MMIDPVGQQLGNYRLVRLLGRGGFADVYLGEHVHLRTQAAIKVLQMRLAEEHTESFINEARTIAHLIHPNIVRVLDFGVHNAVPFLVMDYAPGGTIRRHMPSGRPLPPEGLFPFITQVASALHIDRLVDRFVRHPQLRPVGMVQPQSCRDLPRRPPLPQPGQHQLPDRSARRARRQPRPTSPQMRHLMSPVRLIAPPVQPRSARPVAGGTPRGVLRPVPVAVVAPDLTPHRGPVPAQTRSDLRQ